MGKSKDLASGNSAAYVETAGDTMTGALTVGGNLTVNTDADTSIEFKDGGTNAAFMTAATGDELYIGANNEYAIRIKSDGTKDVAFDNGSRVTMPSQPCFLAVGNAGQTSFSSGAIINIVNEIFDKGSNFDTSNGRFTAPVAGAYFFSYAIYSYDAAKLFSIKINNNDYAPSDTHGLCTAHTTNSMTGTSTILNLAANDYVNVGFRGGHSGSVYINHCHFAGFLIG